MGLMRGLDAALDAAAALAPSASAPLRFPSAVTLRTEAEAASVLAERLRRLALAFEFADRDAWHRIDHRQPVLTFAPVVVDETIVERYLGEEPSGVLAAIIAPLAARIVELESPGSAPGRFVPAASARRAEELDRLRSQVAQLEALGSPTDPLWGGVSREAWLDAASFQADVAAARAQALVLAPTSTRASAARARLSADRDARRRFRALHPFVAAALEHEVIITPGRLALLLDLDAFATMPLDEFLVARGRGPVTRPHLDWTADGCSGPIPASAADACLRHDFLYRNARMIRDQWALPPPFAEQVKSVADDRFGDELWAPYDWYERNPGLAAWIAGAEAAVGAFGSVAAPWVPPGDDEPWGATPPP